MGHREIDKTLHVVNFALVEYAWYSTGQAFSRAGRAIQLKVSSLSCEKKHVLLSLKLTASDRSVGRR